MCSEEKEVVDSPTLRMISALLELHESTVTLATISCFHLVLQKKKNISFITDYTPYRFYYNWYGISFPFPRLISIGGLK